MLKNLNEWTLFLDRDGVINVRKIGEYVRNWSEFIYLPQSDKAIVEFSKIFQRVIVVTNQQGIGKNLMTENDLTAIHEALKADIAQKGGKIDAIYHCPHLASVRCACRKPETGMALQAQQDFPEIDFNYAIMVGDSLTDLQMGQQLNMQNVLILGKGEYIPKPLVQLTCPNLWDFYERLGK